MVYGRDKSQVNWMKNNYEEVNARFSRIHPIFRFGSEEYQHGINEHSDHNAEEIKFTYFWDIPCHWENGVHFRQTKTDISTVLKEVSAPTGLKIHLSPS